MIDRAGGPAPPLTNWLGWEWHKGALAAGAFGVAIVLFAVAALWRGRREPRTPRELGRDDWRGAPLAGVAASVAVASHAAMLTRFRFLHDDFDYLERAAKPFVEPDPSLRWLSTEVVFELGLRVRGHGFFVVANVIALAACLGAFAVFSRSAGARGAEVVLATALFASGRGALDMIRSPAYFQQLLASAVVCASLAVADVRARTPLETRWRRLGLLASLAALGVLGAVTKYPVAAISAPAVLLWLWAARGRLRDALVAAGSAVFGLGLTLLLAHPARAGELDKASADRWGANLRAALRGAFDTVSPWWEVLTITLVTFATVLVLTTPRRAWRARFATAVDGPFRRLTADGGGPTGHLPAWLVIALLYATFQFPFLLNGRYFPPYYVWLPSAPLALLAARMIVRATPSGRAAWAPALLGSMVLTDAVGFVVRDSRSRGPHNDVEAWATSFRALAEQRVAPPVVRVSVACAAGGDIAASRRLLQEFWHFGGSGTALNWAMGWHYTRFELAHEAAPPGPTATTAQIGWCENEPPRWIR
jgi:hypothetical protein